MFHLFEQYHIDILKSGTRRDDLLLSEEEQKAAVVMRRATNGLKADDAAERIIDLFFRTKNNDEVMYQIHKIQL